MLQNLVEAAANSFTLDALIESEFDLVKLLNYEIDLPTRIFFLGRLLLVAEATEKESCYAHFLLELSLLVCIHL
jgi:hypothetical protein